MTEKIWERRESEGDAAWQAFLVFLHGNRNCENVAKELQKTPQHVRRLASKYDWRERAIAYDNSLLEETRQELRRQMAIDFQRRWQDFTELANLAADALRAKIQSASPRTLCEILISSTEKQLAMTDKLKILDEADADDQQLTINIVAAGEPVNL